MSKQALEDLVAVLSEALAALDGGSTNKRSGKSKPAKKPSKRDKLEAVAKKYQSQFNEEDFLDLIEDVAQAETLEDIKDEDIDAVIMEMQAELDEEGGADDDQEPLDVEAVKLAIQAFQKKNGKEDTGEILENFGIKSVRSLHKLKDKELHDLFKDVTE